MNWFSFLFETLPLVQQIIDAYERHILTSDSSNSNREALLEDEFKRAKKIVMQKKS